MRLNLGQLEQEFSALDTLPDTLYDVVITHTHGSLLTRARGILQWREKLLAGELPEIDSLCWPEKTLCKTLLMRIETLELPDFCRGQEDITDSVLKDICEGVSSAEDYLTKTANKFHDKLAQRQNIKDKASSFLDEEGLADHVQTPTSLSGSYDSSSSPDSGHNKETKTRQPKDLQNQPKGLAQHDHAPSDASLQSTAHTTDNANDTKTQQTHSEPCPQGEAHADKQDSVGKDAIDDLQQRWQDIANQWQQLSRLEQEIAHKNKQRENTTGLTRTQQSTAIKKLPGRGWDLSTGLLSSQGWRDIIRYRQRIKEQPELIHFINALGREEEIAGDANFSAVNRRAETQILSNAQGQNQRHKKVPRKTLEMDGIERGDDINRMLPSETVLLCHPTLKTLWHARRAERLLLLYQHRGKHSLGEKNKGALMKRGSLNSQAQRDKSSLGRGPIIVCLDTSGSMQGEPEHIAKAATLEALTVAHREQRACYLVSFSGRTQATLHELDLCQGGLIELLKCLQYSFHGGTDITHALHLALEKCVEKNWKKADILLVSDGRFPVNNALIDTIEHYRKDHKLRLFGVLTGNWQQDTLQVFCDDVLRIRNRDLLTQAFK